MGTAEGHQHIAVNIRRLKRWTVALWLLPLALVLGVVALYVAGNLYFSTERAIHTNWGIAVPAGLREVEHHEEESFHGDGYRFTVFDTDENTQLEGTLFDVRRMSAEDLTSDEIGLVSAITRNFHPQNYLTVPQPGLLKTAKSNYDDKFLCLFDPALNRFYIYEDVF